MSMRFIDGMQHYASADIEKKWTLSLNASISTGTGPGGINSIFCPRQFVGNGGVSKTLDYQSEWIVGFRLYTPHSNASVVPFGSPYGLYTGNAGLIFAISIENDSTISASDGHTVVNYPASKMLTDTFQYFEAKIVLSGTSPMTVTYTIRLDGFVVGTGSFNSWTTPGGNGWFVSTPKANRHVFSGCGIENGSYLNDIYILDGNAGAGSANNDFLNDVTILAIYPASDTATVQFSLNPNSGTHFSKVNETPPDYDTTYVFSNTTGQEDIYNWQTISSFSGTVPGVQYLILARKDDAGIRTIRHIVNATEKPASDEYLNESYVYYIQDYDGDETSTAWTVSKFNSSTFGVELKV